MLITLIVAIIVTLIFKGQILAILEPVLELWTRSFGVANKYLEGVEKDLERTQALTQAEKKHSARERAQSLKEKGITIDDLNLD